jgi:hypothetical protein
VRGFEEVGGPVGLVADGGGGLHLVGVGQRAGGESALLYTRWDGRNWDEPETFGLGQDAAPGSAVSVALDPQSGWLAVVLRTMVTEIERDSQFAVVATAREVAVTAALEPAPTFTPLPTHTPGPTATPRPTATARPQLTTTGVPQALNSGSLQNQEPLLLSAVLAMIIVLGVLMGQVVWARRR